MIKQFTSNTIPNDKILATIARIVSQHHNITSDISFRKLVFLLYYCDWEHSLQHEQQITPIKWRYLNTNNTVNIYRKYQLAEMLRMVLNWRNRTVWAMLFQTHPRQYEQPLTFEEKQTIDMVCEVSLYSNAFKFDRLIFTSFPMLTNNPLINLDLPALARDYKENYNFV